MRGYASMDRRPSNGRKGTTVPHHARGPGHPSGTSMDSEDTLRFARLTDVRPMIETLPLERAAEGLRPDDGRRRAVPHGAHDRAVKVCAIRVNSHGAWVMPLQSSSSSSVPGQEPLSRARAQKPTAPYPVARASSTTA